MKKLAAPQDDYIRTAIRLPRDLHADVRKAAAIAGHTMNAELIARIAGAEDRGAIHALTKQNERILKILSEMSETIELLKYPKDKK